MSKSFSICVVVLALATGCDAFLPAASLFGRSKASQIPRAVSSARPVASRATLGLRAQVGSFGQEDAEVEIPELNEELMLLMAMDVQKKRAVPEGSNVIVFGALDRLGQVVVKTMDKDGRFKPCVQTYEGYENQTKWKIDGTDTIFPEETSVFYNRLPSDVSACVLCVESASDVDQLKGVLSMRLPIQRFVMVSKGGIDLREDDWKLKMNPFLQLDKWNLLEETLQQYAENADWDYTIIRAGDLQGGPFFNTNFMFDKALEDRIFDGETQGIVVKKGDQSGKTGRDVLASCIVECLGRPEAANKVISLTSHKMFREDGIKCSVDNALEIAPDAGKDGQTGRPRTVFTPSKEEWDSAFEKL